MKNSIISIDNISLLDWRAISDYYILAPDLILKEKYWGLDNVISCFQDQDYLGDIVWRIYFCGFESLSNLHLKIYNKDENEISFSSLEEGQVYVNNFIILYNKLKNFI